jgi:hypothetical protein
VNEHGERGVFARFRQEQIDELPRRIAVGQAELGAPGLEHVGAIILRLPRPAGKNFRMLRHAGAIVVLGFVVDGGHRRLPLDQSEIAAWQLREQVEE